MHEDDELIPNPKSEEVMYYVFLKLEFASFLVDYSCCLFLYSEHV